MKFSIIRHAYAPELTEILVNKVNITPRLRANDFNWSASINYGVNLANMNYKELVARLRAKFFRKPKFTKVLLIEVTYPAEFSYLNQTYRVCFKNYSEIKSFLARLARKHNINGDMTYNSIETTDKSIKQVVKPMPRANIKVRTESKFN